MGQVIKKLGESRYVNDEGQLHRRFDRPAIERKGGTKEWWFEGLRHRLGGPAITTRDGKSQWFLKGIEYTEEEFNKIRKR